MFQKIKNQTVFYAKQLSDFSNIGLIVFTILFLLVSWSVVGAIQTNYELQKKISKLEQQNKVKELENSNLKLKNEYLNTDQFLELSSRRQFGKARPGEVLINVPENVALSKTVKTKPSTQESQKSPEPHKPKYQQNFEAWTNWFMHRVNGDN